MEPIHEVEELPENIGTEDHRPNNSSQIVLDGRQSYALWPEDTLLPATTTSDLATVSTLENLLEGRRQCCQYRAKAHGVRNRKSQTTNRTRENQATQMMIVIQ